MALAGGVSLSLVLRDVGYEQLLGSSFCMSLVPTAGIIRNVTLMGRFGFSRGRRVKIQAQLIWKKNGSVQEVLYTTCAQKGTVCQIFISSGLVHKSGAADAAELPLSLPGSTKGCWIKRLTVLRLHLPRVNCHPGCFGSGDLEINPPDFSAQFCPHCSQGKCQPSLFEGKRWEDLSTGKGQPRGVMIPGCMNQNCCAPCTKGMLVLFSLMKSPQFLKLVWMVPPIL